MRYPSWILASCLVLLGSVAVAGPISQDLTIDGAGGTDLRHDNTGNSAIVVNNYAIAGDGGGGTFVKIGSTCSGSSFGADDGGVVIQATAGCYVRQFAGAVHLKWYGVTFGQDITSSCYGGTNCLMDAFNAAKNFANSTSNPNYVGTVDLDGLRIFSGADITPLSNQRLTCGATQTGENVDSMNDPDYSKIGGAIDLAHNARIYIINQQTEFDHCIVVTEGVSGTSPVTLNPTTQRNVIDDYHYMAVNGDTGVQCDQGADSAYIHDVTVVGFDTGIAAFSCPRFRLDSALVDANVGIFIGNGKSPAYTANARVDNLLALRVNNKDTSDQIKSIFNDGSGACRVEYPAVDVALQNGDTVFVFPSDQTDYTDMGVISCHGRFIAASVSTANCPAGSTCVTLQGSTYGSSSSPYDFLTTTTGNTWVKNSQVLNIPAANTSAVRAGELMRSSDTTVFGGASATILSVSKYPKNGEYKIVVNMLTRDSSSGSPTLTFSNVGSYNTTNRISKLYLFPSLRIAAGNSIGGAATGGRAACIQGGGPGDTSALSIIGNNVFCFGHLLQYHFDSIDPLICTGCGSDSQPDISDDQQIGLYYGSGLKPLVLTGDTHGTGSNTVDNLKLNGVPFNPCYAGWRIGDVLISASGDIPASDTIHSMNCSILSPSIQLTTNTTGTGLSGQSITDTIANPPIDLRQPTGASDFIGSIVGGGNVIVDAIDTDLSQGPCNAVSGTTIGTNMKGRFAVELLAGCVNLTSVSSSQQNDVLIGGALAPSSSILGSHFKNSIYYENPSQQSVNTAGNTFDGGSEGNGVRQCNANYATGCIQYSLNSLGAWRLLDSSLNPVQEFKDSAHMHLDKTYQDSLQANVTLSAPTVAAGVNIVSSCVGGSCTSKGVKLPLTALMLDVSSTPTGSACASAGSGNCGAAGGITIVNNTSSTITIWPASTGSETVNGGASDQIQMKRTKTYWPFVGAPGGWITTTPN